MSSQDRGADILYISQISIQRRAVDGHQNGRVFAVVTFHNKELARWGDIKLSEAVPLDDDSTSADEIVRQAQAGLSQRLARLSSELKLAAIKFESQQA